MGALATRACAFLLPAKAPGDHEVEDEMDVVVIVVSLAIPIEILERNNDAFFDATEAIDAAADRSGERRIHRAQQRRDC